jgi:hypothetical protein
VRRRKIPRWIRMGPEPYFATCERCGKQEPMPELPIPVDALLRYGDYVGEKHRLCPEAKCPC